MNKYIYPDIGDNLTTSYIKLNSNEKYWEESEKNILNIVTTRIQELKNKPKFLDLGCGIGRLFSTFYPYVQTITALEPDKERYNCAKNEAIKIDNKKINVINSEISDIKDYKYDVVLISHVIQHIPFESVEKIFNILSDIVPSGGIIIITTTYTNCYRDKYTLEFFNEGKYFSKNVTKKEFTKNFSKKEILPVRIYSFNTIKKLFEDNNFILEKKFAYHFDISSAKNTMNIETDNRMNKLNKLVGAKDILYIIKKI